MTKTTHFFGECARYTKGEKDEAVQYLESWKKFLVRKLNRECMTVKVIDESFVEKDTAFDGPFSEYCSVALKLAIEIEFKFEVGPFGVY